MPEIARIFTGRIDAMLRYVVLSYQLGAVTKSIEGLDRHERLQLVELANRKTRGIEIETRTSGDAFARIRSGNSYMRVMALAQWLSIAYQETRDSANGDLNTLHKKLQRTLRGLRESVQTLARAA